ncbi:MAG TPA: ABC transporter permease [Streptosporangiaceae bacterium]|nr:ABC transporter permease [Streptosporangiaceae bacterium]
MTRFPAVGEAVDAIVARPLPAVAAGLGSLLAVAWFVTALGLVSTAAGHTAIAFGQRLATIVRVSPAGPGLPGGYSPFPADVEQRLDGLHGVVAAGVYWQLRPGGPTAVSAKPVPAGQAGAAASAAGPAVIAASPGYLSAAGVQLSQGRLFDAWDQAHALPACLVGAAVAAALRSTVLADQPVVYIGGLPCVVLGIVSRAVRQPSLRRSVLLPSSAAVAFWGQPPQAGPRPAVLIQTRPGAAALVARQAPVAISLAGPRRFRAVVPAGPVLLRDQVNATFDGLYAAVGWISLTAAILSIGVVSAASALRSAPEYAVRRALDARRRLAAPDLTGAALTGAALTGLLGGLAGASLGVAVVVLVAHACHWLPVIAPLSLWPAPLAGAAAAAAASLGPAPRTALAGPERDRRARGRRARG